MAFPTVVSVTKSREDSDVTTSNAAYPGTVASGDRAILLVGMDGSATAPDFSATGMTQIASAQYGLVVGAGAAWKNTTGSEGGTTEDWTHGTAQTCSMMVIVTGADRAQPPAIQQTGSSTAASTADPPSLTPPWSSIDSIFMAFGVHNGAPETISAYPTNYSDNQNSDANTAAQGVSVGFASRELNTGSAEDPGTFTFSGSVAWAASTLAVLSAGAGVQRLDPAQGAIGTGFSYPVSSAANRMLVVCVGQADGTAAVPSVTFGGQSMTLAWSQTTSSSRYGHVFILLESGIAAASGSTISVSGATATITFTHAQSFFNAKQETPTNTGSTWYSSSTNPISHTLSGVVAGSVSHFFAVSGDPRSAAWTAPIVEKTDVVEGNSPWASSTTGDSVAASGSVVGEVTWNNSVFGTLIGGMEIKEAVGSIIPLIAYHRSHNIGSAL